MLEGQQVAAAWTSTTGNNPRLADDLAWQLWADEQCLLEPEAPAIPLFDPATAANDLQQASLNARLERAEQTLRSIQQIEADLGINFAQLCQQGQLVFNDIFASCDTLSGIPRRARSVTLETARGTHNPIEAPLARTPSPEPHAAFAGLAGLTTAVEAAALRPVERPRVADTTLRPLSPEAQAAMRQTIENMRGRFDLSTPEGRRRFQEFQRNLEETARRCRANRFIADPSAEMLRICRSIDRTLASDGRIEGEQIYSRHDLTLIAESIARRCANPARFCNQGFHNTCALQSRQESALATNPARVAEQIASLALTGTATVGPPGQERAVRVHRDSLRLDREARMFTTAGSTDGRGMRDAGGQLMDLLMGQLRADCHTERDRAAGRIPASQRYEYRQAANPGAGQTGESYVLADTGNGRVIRVLGDNPRITAHDLATLARLYDGDSGVFCHQSLASGPGLRSYRDVAELHRMVREYQERTGRPAQVLVFAGHLPGRAGRSSGHDLHAMTVRANADGTFTGSNQWGDGSDREVARLTGDQMLFAMAIPGTVRRPAEGAPVPPAPARPVPVRPGEVPYDQRFIDPGNSVPLVDRAPQRNEMERLAEELRLREEKRRLEQAHMEEEQGRYAVELARWYEERLRFESDPANAGRTFTRPRPVRPDTTSVWT